MTKSTQVDIYLIAKGTPSNRPFSSTLTLTIPYQIVIFIELHMSL